MRTIITIVAVWISLISWAQSPLEVTIIGITHAFQKEYQDRQDFKKVQDFIIDLDPDIICIEAIPTTDTLSLKEIWPKNMKRADKMRQAMIDRGHLPFSAASYETDSEALRFQGAASYSIYDLWNAYYHWFRVLQKGDSLYQFTPYMKDLSRSEYGLMVYPAAIELGVDHSIRLITG